MKEYNIKSKLGYINVLEGVDIHLDICKGIMLHVHGFSSHFQFVYNSNNELINRDNFFSQHGYKTFGFEFHGHGKSDGACCVINKFDDLLDDLYVVIKFININYPNKKIFLIGESMGGAVIIKYIAERIHQISGIVLLSPMCGIDENLKPSPFMVKLLLILSNIIPSYPLYYVNKELNDCSSMNEEYKIAFNNNKYTYNGAFTLCTVREIYHTSLQIASLAPLINIPIIIFHGLTDKVTNPNNSIKFYENINCDNKKIVLIENKDHKLLIPKTKFDKNPDKIYNQILEWLDNLI